MTSPKNVFGAPIVGMIDELSELKWEFPYIQVIASTFAILAVLTVLGILYPTVGVFLQITTILAKITEEAYGKLCRAQSFERIGHATAVGVLFLIYLPFAIIGWPLYWFATMAQKLFDFLAKLLD